MKLITPRSGPVSLRELSAEDLDNVHGGDRGFVPCRAPEAGRDTPAGAETHLGVVEPAEIAWYRP
jgi:hypothetical protein